MKVTPLSSAAKIVSCEAFSSCAPQYLLSPIAQVPSAIWETWMPDLPSSRYRIASSSWLEGAATATLDRPPAGYPGQACGSTGGVQAGHETGRMRTIG